MSATKTKPAPKPVDADPFDTLMNRANPEVLSRPTGLPKPRLLGDDTTVVNLNVRVQRRMRDKLKLRALHRNMTVQDLMEEIIEAM